MKMQNESNAILFFSFGIILSFLLNFFLQAEPLKFDIQGEAGILMNAETGMILYERNASVSHYPASTTKVATALYALKFHEKMLDQLFVAKADSLLTITQEAKRKSNYTLPSYRLEPDGMHIGIKKGEVFSLRVLLEGMLVPSGNDAANVIAESLGPGVGVFMEKLNVFLKDIGCLNTHFTSPHGLHDTAHVTTAFDLALVAKEALKFPVFCEIVSKTRFMRPKTGAQVAATYLQTNRLLRPGKMHYPKAIGIKTGYHAKAKKTFIGAAQVDGRKLIAVLLNYKDSEKIFEDAIKLFEAAFNQPKVERVYLNEGVQTFQLKLPKANSPIKTYLKEPLSLDYYPAEDPLAKCFLHWESISLPVLKGQQVGELHLVSRDGKFLKKTSLFARKNVGFKWPYNWHAVISSFPWLWITLTIGLVGGIAVILKMK